MTDKQILYASLIGSKLAKAIPRFAAVQNELQKHVLYPIPFLPFQNEVEQARAYYWDESKLGTAWGVQTSIPKEKQFFPCLIMRPDDAEWWMLPYEPMINISGKNTIVKRNVAKKNAMKNDVGNTRYFGTIKEYWAQDDYEITITGALYGAIERGSVEECFPLEDFLMLKDYLTQSPHGLAIQCFPLNNLGIHNIVIEDFSFPFTKGEYVQAYEIKAVSDGWYDLFISDDGKYL